MNQDMINAVREWVEVDDNLRARTKQVSLLRERKGALEVRILDYVKKNNLSDAQIRISDGNIRFAEKSSYESITLKYMKEQLENCFEEARRTGAVLSAEKVYDYVVSHRKVYKKFEMARAIESAVGAGAGEEH